LAAQKFITDIATDSLQYYKIRQQNAQQKDKRPTFGYTKKTVLTMEDLTAALQDNGIDVHKPDYYA
jgi:transcription initiation factor TFIID subunit 10